MFRHYFRIAFRSLLKFKVYSLINVTSLVLGISAAVLMMVYVWDETSFDQFHAHGPRLYRVVTHFGTDQEPGGHNETNAWPIGDLLRRQFPEVEAVLYARSAGGLMVTFEGKKVHENAHFVSPEFFTLFSFPLTKGNAQTALRDPFTLVISEKMEAKYFPGQSALGQTLTFNDTLVFHVTGVMKNIPINSHIQADMLPSFASWEKLNPDFSYSNGWGNFNMRNYVLLKPGTELTAFADKARDLYHQVAGDQLAAWGVHATVAFEPFDRVYLHSRAGNGMGPLGSITHVYLLSAVAFFVLLLACINFVNLATARSVYRAKEVGIKKVVGSTRARLVGQFLSESLVITTVSFLLALAVMGLFLPLFNQLVGKSYTLAHLFDYKMGVGMLVLLFLITLTAGYYPAWVMSAFKPVEILKARLQTGTRGVQLRRTLVVAQFIVSVSLVAGTLIVIRQLAYMQNRELGFTRDEIFVVDIARARAADGTSHEAFAHELKAQTVVEEVTFCNALPAVSGWRGQWAYPEGHADEDHLVEMQYIAADEKYVPTLDLTLVAGRNFDPQRTSDRDALIINEEAVRQMGWGTPENAIGKKVVSPSQHPAGTVIGVVKDYHDWGLQNKIAPCAIDFTQTYASLYAVRFDAAHTETLIETAGALWKKHFPENEFTYFFLRETFAKQYAREQRLAQVFTLFSVITILIAAIGLFGLVSFLVTAKTKEIGIRKVLGASAWNIMSLLSREFVVLVLIANVAAVPLVVFAAQRWLEGFAYRTELNPLIFVTTVAIALAVTLLTVSVQTIQAASTDPAHTLRSE